jgi:hypothetical protein
MDIMQVIEQKVAMLISKSQGTMSQADALSEIFKRDPGLYWQYRQASLYPEEQTPAAKAEAPSASGGSVIPLAVQLEVLRTAEAFDPQRPLSSGLEKLRQVLRKARQG